MRQARLHQNNNSSYPLTMLLALPEFDHFGTRRPLSMPYELQQHGSTSNRLAQADPLSLQICSQARGDMTHKLVQGHGRLGAAAWPA